MGAGAGARGACDSADTGRGSVGVQLGRLIDAIRRSRKEAG